MRMGEGLSDRSPQLIRQRCNGFQHPLGHGRVRSMAVSTLATAPLSYEIAGQQSLQYRIEFSDRRLRGFPDRHDDTLVRKPGAFHACTPSRLVRSNAKEFEGLDECLLMQLSLFSVSCIRASLQVAALGKPINHPVLQSVRMKSSTANTTPSAQKCKSS